MDNVSVAGSESNADTDSFESLMAEQEPSAMETTQVAQVKEVQDILAKKETKNMRFWKFVVVFTIGWLELSLPLLHGTGIL